MNFNFEDENGGLIFTFSLLFPVMATLQTRAEVTVRSKLSELRKVCDKKIETHQQKIDSSFETFGNFLQSHRYKAQITAQNQGFPSLLFIHSIIKGIFI